MAGVQPVEQPKYVDFGEYILFQIQRTRALVRQTDTLLLAVSVLAAVVVVLLAFVMLDHWAFTQGLSHPLRWLGFAGVAASLLTGLFLYWKTAARKNVTELYAADMLEKADGRLANNLLTLVDLNVNSQAADPLIRGSMEKRAALRLHELDVDHAVDRSDLLHRLYALLGCTVLLCGYGFFAPKSVPESVYRVLLPWVDTSPPTQTKILDVQPGSQTVTSGSHVVISAFIDGKIPEDVWLVYSTADERIVDERIRLLETDEGLGKYTATIHGENGRGIDQSTTYFLEAGDARTIEYQLSVRPSPRSTLTQIQLTPPPYTERPQRTQQNGSIDAIEGTVVELTAQTNLPVKQAWIQLFNSEDPADQSGQIALSIGDETQLTGSWTLKIRDDGTYPRFYRIECETADEVRDPAPPLHAVLVRPDARPEIRLLDPTTDLERPLNATVPLLIEAFDPDFRLSGLSIQIEKQGQLINSELIDAENRRSMRLQYPLELSRLPLEPGDEITYWAIARDNRQPRPNQRITSKLKIRITEPVSQEQAEQQKLADETRQQQENPPADPADPNQMADPQRDPETKQSGSEDQMSEDSQESSSSQESPSEQGSDATQGAGNESETQSGESQSGKTKSGQTDSTETKPGGSDSDQNQSGTEGGESTAEPGKDGENSKPGERPNPSQQPEKSMGEKLGEQAAQNQDDSENTDAPKTDPKYDPQGEDDDQVLEKLIDKLKREQEQQKQSEPSKPSAAEQKPDRGEQSAGEPQAENDPASDTMAPEQQPGNEPNTQKSDSETPDSAQNNPQQNADENSGKQPDSTQQPTEQPGQKPATDEMKDPSAAEKTDPETPENAEMPVNEGQPAGEPKQPEGDKQEQNGTSEMKQPGEQQQPSQPGEGSKPDPNGEGPARQSDAADPEQKTGEMKPAQEPGTGEAKPGQGDEQGPTERETDPNKSGPDAQKPLDQPEGEKSIDTNNANPSKTTPADRSMKPGDQQTPNDSQPKDGQPGDEASDSGQKGGGETPSGEQKSGDPNSKTGKPAGAESTKPGDSNAEKTKPGQMESAQPNSPTDETGKPESGSSDSQNSGGQKPDDGKSQNQTEEQPGKPTDDARPDADSMSPEQNEKQPPGGEQGEKSGDPAGKQGGETGQGKGEGEGKPGDSQSSGKGQPGNQQTGTGTESDREAGGGNSTGMQNSDRQGNARGGQGDGVGKPSDEAAQGEPRQSQAPNTPESLEDRRKAAELVLDQLEEDLKRGDVDQEMLDELGWSKDNLKQFQQRMSDYLRSNPDGDQPNLKQQQFNEMLKNMRLGDQRPGRTGQQGGKISRDEFAPQLRPAPPEYRDIEQAFRRSLSESNNKSK